MPLPAFLPVSTALTRGSRYEGVLDSAELEGLKGLIQTGRPLQVALEFVRARGNHRLNGRIAGELELQCERCAATYPRVLDLVVDLRLVQSDEEERQVLADADPWHVEEDRIPVAALVEQEILLDLPVIRRCPACEAALEAAATSGGMPTHRPFAGLRPQ